MIRPIYNRAPILTRPPIELKTADELARTGEADYHAGNLEAAGKLLEQAVAADRRHARAHWLLGNIAQDQGKLDRAISCYRRALRAASQLAEAHNDLGTAYFAKGWHVEAEQCYRRAIELQPANVAASGNLAAALRAQGRLSEARRAFVRTLKLRITEGLGRLFGRMPGAAPAAAPSDAQRTGEQARVAAKEAFGAGRLDEAEQRLRELLATAPEDAAAHHLLGNVLAAAGRRADAISAYDRAVSLHSSTPEFYVSLGNVLTDERRYDEALRNYQVALMLDPGSGAAQANVARVLHELGHYREAEEVYRQSLQHEPDLAGAHSSLAGTLISMGKYPEAERAARNALELRPDSLHARVMLANAQQEQGRIEEACATIQAAGAAGERNFHVQRWLGLYHLVFRGEHEAARTHLERASAISPTDAGVHINLARTLLARGRYAEGWEEYEWRKRDPARTSVYNGLPHAEWNGEPLQGKALLVNGEQGLGDEVMFASCLAEIAARAQRCVLLCARRLEPLFRRSFPYAEVVGGSHRSAANDPFPALRGIDFQIAAGSLPRSLRRSAAEFPRHDGYLKADQGRIEEYRRRLDSLGKGLKVGLSWRGGTPLSDQTRRTLALETLAPLLGVPGVHWVSLQHGNCTAEREASAARSGIALHHWQEAIDNLDRLAALISALNLRISVCNTQVHLSGGLGREVWVLAPLAPDWRYGVEGDGMPWYPAARMFRQERAGDWAPVVERVRAELARRTL